MLYCLWFQKGSFGSILKIGLCVTSLKNRFFYRCFPVSFHKCLGALSFVLQRIVFQLQNSWYSLRSKDVIKHVQNRKHLISISFLGGKKKKKEWKNPEAVIWRCSVEKECLKISQNSQKNNCAGVSFYWFKLFSCVFFRAFARFLGTPTLKNICEWLLFKIMFIRILLYNNWRNLLKQFPQR